MNHFYYILYDLDSVRKLNPIKRQICYSKTDKNIKDSFNLLVELSF